MELFISIIAVGVIGSYILIRSVDQKHTHKNSELEEKVNRNQSVIKDTTKEILGYDPFDISVKDS
jgi:hypothetical protein